MVNSSGTHHKYGNKKLDKMSPSEKKKFFMRQNKLKYRKSKPKEKKEGIMQIIIDADDFDCNCNCHKQEKNVHSNKE